MAIQYNRCYLCGRKSRTADLSGGHHRQCRIRWGLLDPVTFSAKDRIRYFVRWLFGHKCIDCHCRIEKGQNLCPLCWAEREGELLAMCNEADFNYVLSLLKRQREQVQVKYFGDLIGIFDYAGSI